MVIIFLNKPELGYFNCWVLLGGTVETADTRSINDIELLNHNFIYLLLLFSYKNTKPIYKLHILIVITLWYKHKKQYNIPVKSNNNNLLSLTQVGFKPTSMWITHSFVFSSTRYTEKQRSRNNTLFLVWMNPIHNWVF